MAKVELYKKAMALFGEEFSVGWTCSEIADKLGISDETAREVLRGLEVLAIIRKAPEQEMTQETIYIRRHQEWPARS